MTKSEIESKLPKFSSSIKKFSLGSNVSSSIVISEKNASTEPSVSLANSCQIEIDEISSNTRSLKSELPIKNSAIKLFTTDFNFKAKNKVSNPALIQNVNKSISLNNLSSQKKINQIAEKLLPEENATSDKGSSNFNSNLDESISIEFDFNNNNNNNFNNKNNYHLVKNQDLH